MKARRILVCCVTAIAILVSAMAPARADYFEDAVMSYRIGEYPDAFEMFMKLAKQGNPKAQFWIGTMWYQGKGKPQNYREAFRWYLRSAYRGNADSQNSLGLIYRKGVAQPANSVVAYAWFALAAAKGNDIARTNLEAVTEELKPTQDKILEGQALAQEYLTLIEAATAPTRPAVTPAALPRRDLSEAQEVFVVQLGLFEKASSIKNVRRDIRKHDLKAQDDTVEIRGHVYERFRLGPYQTAQAAEAMALKVNKLFNVKSAVIPLLR